MAYKYFAFISYRHTDALEAKGLQKLLETYSLPAALQKVRPDAPTRFHVFRDEDELTSGELTEELHKKLDESKWLVVICSPDSAQSKYVGQEIAYFRQKGRSKEIIPFIIDGVPHSADRECFHPQLTLGGLELLGIDVQAEPSRFWRTRFHRAFIRLMAKMLDLSFDELWQRRKRYLRRLRMIQITILAIIVGAIAYALSSRPFDANVSLATTIKTLPLSADGSDSIYVYLSDNDVRAMPITSLDRAIMFPNIPGKYHGKKTRVVCRAYGFNALDTIVGLSNNLSLKLTRNAATFGRIRYRLVSDATEQPVANATIDFGFLQATTDAAGVLNVLIPLEHQKEKYSVKISCNGKPLHLFYGNGSDTLSVIQSSDTVDLYVK